MKLYKGQSHQTSAAITYLSERRVSSGDSEITQMHEISETANIEPIYE
jgi:hypothetical protein